MIQKGAPTMKAVFLDRDGVINRNHKPVNKPRDLVLYPWVISSLRLLKSLDYRLFVVTNQGGISAGYFTEEALQKIHNKLDIETNHVIDEISHCPHIGNNCECRKPKPGMLNSLIKKHSIDPSASFMIGDRDVDIIAGQGAGLTTIAIGKKSHGADYRVDNLLEAANIISDLSTSNDKDRT